MVIGYSFRDEHINQVIVRAVKNHGLRFFVIDPSGSQLVPNVDPTTRHLIDRNAIELSEAFELGLIGASRRPLRDLFGTDSIEYAKLMRFFDQT